MSKLVHIKKIEMVEAGRLLPMRIVSGHSCRFDSAVNFSEIAINELVGVTVEGSMDNNQYIYTTTATFQTCDKTPFEGRRLAFRLTGIDGKQYMIGKKDRPYPIIKVQDNFPDKPAGSTARQITVVWKSTCPMLNIE